jgi:hypothetical protein
LPDRQSAGAVYSRTVALPPPVPSPHVARHSNRLLITKASSISSHHPLHTITEVLKHTAQRDGSTSLLPCVLRFGTTANGMALLIQALFDWTWQLLWPEIVGTFGPGVLLIFTLFHLSMSAMGEAVQSEDYDVIHAKKRDVSQYPLASCTPP